MSIFNKLHSRLADPSISEKISTDPLDQLFKHFKERLLKESNLDQLIGLPDYQKRKTIEKIIHAMIDEEKVIIPLEEKDRLLQMILDDSVGYGPLEPLLHDEEITEIMVNSPTEVYIEKNGKIALTDVSFKSQEHIRNIIDRIIAPIGRRIDESSPLVDGRLLDGSRVNAAIPPISLNSPVITIRKFKKDPYNIEDLIAFGSMSEKMASFLQMAVASKLNMIISGGTGSGKTTLLNVLSAAIPGGERVITIEDMAELRLNRRNVVALEARPMNMEGSGEITIRQLVKNALRMRPDRIIVGEVRGGEALDMLQAMNTGHEGSLTTVHANSAQDALSRLEAMIIMSNPALTVDVLKPYISAAVDLIVQTTRLSDGTRKVVSISELRTKGTELVLEDIFYYDRTGVGADGTVVGQFKLTHIPPQCTSKIRAFGHDLPDEFFQEVREEG